jgi:hypothetical protein
VTTFNINFPGVALRNNVATPVTVAALLNTSAVPAHIKTVEYPVTETTVTGVAGTRWILDMAKITAAAPFGSVTQLDASPVQAPLGLFVFRNTEMQGGTAQLYRRVLLAPDKIVVSIASFITAFGGIPGGLWLYKHTDTSTQPITLAQNEALVFRSTSVNATTDSELVIDLNLEVEGPVYGGGGYTPWPQLAPLVSQ